jgi:hypothetical protein
MESAESHERQAGADGPAPDVGFSVIRSGPVEGPERGRSAPLRRYVARLCETRRDKRGETITRTTEVSLARVSIQDLPL